MKRSISILIVSITMFMGVVNAQHLTLNQVLERYYIANGIDKMKDWQTITTHAKFIYQDSILPMTIVLKRPDKVRIEVNIRDSILSVVMAGQQGWTIIPWLDSANTQNIAENDMLNLKEQPETRFESPLYNWKEKGYTLKLRGKRDVDGHPAYKIKVILSSGGIETYFIDAKTFMVSRIISKSKSQGKNAVSDNYYSDYRDVRGVMVPYLTEYKYTTEKGKMVNKLLINEIEINKVVSDSLFIKPLND